MITAVSVSPNPSPVEAGMEIEVRLDSTNTLPANLKLSVNLILDVAVVCIADTLFH